MTIPKVYLNGAIGEAGEEGEAQKSLSDQSGCTNRNNEGQIGTRGSGMILLIALERKPYRSIPKFFDEIKTHVEFVKRVMPGVWLIDTQECSEVWAERLRPHIDQNDTLLVIRVASDYDGWLVGSVWEWLNISRLNGDFG